MDRDSFVQEIWLKAYEDHKPLTYLFVRNRCIDLMRKQKIHAQPLPNELIAKEANPQHPSLDTLLDQCALTPIEWKVATATNGLSRPASLAAKDLHISSNRIHKHIRAIKHKLRQLHKELKDV